jgi:pilus assembly protein Flp/PilA
MLEVVQSLMARYVAMREDEEGQALVEYALILALVSVVSIAALTLLGGNISSILNQVANKL